MPIKHFSPVAPPEQAAFNVPADPAPYPSPTPTDEPAIDRSFEQLPQRRKPLITRLSRNVYRLRLMIRNGISLKHTERNREGNRVDRWRKLPAVLRDDQAVERALRCLFAEDYQEMLDDRSWLEDELLETLCNPTSSDLQRNTAQAQLKMLDSFETEWYRAKILEALHRISPDSQ